MNLEQLEALTSTLREAKEHGYDMSALLGPVKDQKAYALVAKINHRVDPEQLLKAREVLGAFAARLGLEILVHSLDDISIQKRGDMVGIPR